MECLLPLGCPCADVAAIEVAEAVDGDVTESSAVFHLQGRALKAVQKGDLGPDLRAVVGFECAELGLKRSGAILRMKRTRRQKSLKRDNGMVLVKKTTRSAKGFRSRL